MYQGWQITARNFTLEGEAHGTCGHKSMMGGGGGGGRVQEGDVPPPPPPPPPPPGAEREAKNA